MRCLARITELFATKALLAVPATSNEPRGVRELEALALSVRPLEPLEAASRSSTRPTPPRASARPELPLSLPDRVRLVLVGGKGGVGKTSVACAAAIALAEREPGKRVLLLSTDPAHSVGDAMGAVLGDDAVVVKGGPRNLRVRELDARSAFEEEKRRYRAAINELFDSIFKGKMDASFDRQVLEDLLDLAPPGLDELFAILSIVEALLPARPEYDVVIVDTAPTGHTLRLLELPASALAWVHAIMSVILKYRHVVGLGELASDLTALAKQLRQLIALLADRERTAFVAVARAAALPRLETERLVAKLKKLRVPLAAVVVNAVTSPSCGRCIAAAALEAPEIVRLASIAKRRRARAVYAPAVHPPPRGPEALRTWCASWSSRAMLGAHER
jgi:arsenite-transporting ATPase